MNISLKNVCLNYSSQQRVLHDINLDVQQGERIAIIGASGAGKTSLLRLLATALRPTSGEIELCGQRPWQVSRHTLRKLRARIGMVYQASVLPPRQRVVTAVLAGKLGQWPLWKSFMSLIYPQDIQGARKQLAKLELADKLFVRCDHLSGGQQQRVAVARTLYQAPDLMLADEPVSSIDPVLAERIIEVLVREAEGRQVTLVASLHAVDLALTWFPRVIGIREGSIVFDLPAGQISAKQLHELYVGRDQAKEESIFTRDVSTILRQSIC